MISIPYTRDISGKILIERELTDIEKQKLVRQTINVDTVDYYFNDDVIIDVFNIEDHKKALIDKIDLFIEAEIFKGFVYNGKTFSMSINAQINWNNILLIPSNIFPLSLMTIDEELVQLPLEEKNAFYQASLNYKYSKLQLGHSLKTAVKNLTTVEEINNFIIE